MSDLFIPSLVVAEIRFGLGRLPLGRRRDTLTHAFGRFLETGFYARILSFDAACAEGYATARLRRERAGRPIQIQDALIGGMAITHGATLATCNVTDFDAFGLDIINPWDAG
jgi:predicted nucleic acid-binding protein